MDSEASTPDEPQPMETEAAAPQGEDTVPPETEAPVDSDETEESAGAESEEAANDAPPPPPQRTMVDILREQLAEKEKQLHDYIAAYRDAKRDMDDRLARAKRDREKLIDRDRKQLTGSLLEVLDNLDRSVAGMGDHPGVEGLRMVHRQFTDVLLGFGVERMEALGATFDANLHEAIGMVPAHGAQRDQEIVHVDRAGYTFKGELLRPARVVVATAA